MITWNSITSADMFIRSFESNNVSYTRLAMYMDFVSQRRYDRIMQYKGDDGARKVEEKLLYDRLTKEMPLRAGKTRAYFAEFTKPSAFEFANNNTLDYDSFLEFFPVIGKTMNDTQYNKCYNCSKNQTCGKDYNCLKDIEDDPSKQPSTCEKGIESVIKLNDQYIEQIKQFNQAKIKWLDEYNKWYYTNSQVQMVSATITGLWNMDSMSFLAETDAPFWNDSVLKLNNIDPANINFRDSYWTATDRSTQSGVRQVEFYYKNEYIASKIQQLQTSEPHQPPPPSWGEIVCVDCRNIIDWSNIGSLTDVQIQQLNDCVVNIDKKPDPLPSTAIPINIRVTRFGNPTPYFHFYVNELDGQKLVDKLKAVNYKAQFIYNSQTFDITGNYQQWGSGSSLVQAIEIQKNGTVILIDGVFGQDYDNKVFTINFIDKNPDPPPKPPTPTPTPTPTPPKPGPTPTPKPTPTPSGSDIYDYLPIGILAIGALILLK